MEITRPLANRTIQPLGLPRTHGRGAWKILTLPYLFFILVPLAALFWRISPADLVTYLGQETVQQAIGLSLRTSLLSVLFSMLLGTPVAYYLIQPRYRFHRLVDTLIDLPTVLPPAVAGVALLMAFGRRGLLGESLNLFGITLPFTQAAVVMAQTFIAAPLYIRAATLGLSSVDCELRKAAALDGANRWQCFTHIMLPIAWPSIFSGSVMTWARALGEFGATIIFAGNFPGRTQTMPLAIYIGFEMDLNLALILSVILVCVSLVTLILVKLIVSPSTQSLTENDYD